MNLWQFMLQNHVEVLELTLEHFWLVAISTGLAVLVGIPLGILITRWPWLNKPILGGAPTSFKPFPASPCSDSFCPRPGSGPAPTASPFLR